MKLLVLPVMILSCILIVHIIFKEVQKWWVYFTIFILILFGLLIFSSNAEASSFSRHGRIHIARSKNLSWDDRRFYQEKKEFHRKEGERTFKEAKDRCMWLPTYSDREMAQNCFLTALSGLACGTPQSRVISMLIVSLGQYGLGVMSEYDKIENKLNWSKYHFELYDFYKELLGE